MNEINFDNINNGLIKAVGWGSGKIFISYRRLIHKFPLLYTINDDIKIIGKSILGVSIVSPKELNKIDTENTILIIYSVDHKLEIINKTKSINNLKILYFNDPRLFSCYENDVYDVNLISKFSDINRYNLFTNDKDIVTTYRGKTVTKLHLEVQTNTHLQKLAFKQGVNYIDIETSSQCNRICNYCPNSYNDRRSKNIFMDMNLFESIIDQLSEIDYSEELHFVGYNEPLMHGDELIKYLKYARSKLTANLIIYTNGDFLTKDLLHKLEHIKINELRISVHLAPNESFEKSKIFKRINSLAKLLNLSIENNINSEDYVKCELHGSTIKINIFQGNYQENGSDRGGLLNSIKFRPNRTSACSSPLNQFTIGYNGNVMPCCVMVHDDKSHSNNIVGELTKSNIFDIYSNKEYTKWRISSLNMLPKNGPCKNCSHYSNDIEHLDESKTNAIIEFLKK